MPDDNELLFFLRWARPIFRDERGYSHKEELRFQWRKTDLIETEKHGRLLKVLGNCAFHVVLESYAVQAWGLLWCFYSDGLSEQQYHNWLHRFKLSSLTIPVSFTPHFQP
jgi:hypothetical protein